MHNVKDSSENYLEAILLLSRRKGRVRSVDVAHYLDLSRPSVSKAMKKLVDAGELIMEEDGSLVLTDAGRAIGEQVYERHLLFKNLLMKAGVEESLAEEDGCKMEHAISDESFARLKAFVEKL